MTRLIFDTHDRQAFRLISHLTVGDFRNWILNDHTTGDTLRTVANAITPEIAAAVSKIMRNQDLILAASKCQVITRFRNTIGLPGRLSARLQPNHPTDDLKGIAASIIDGLMYGCGDAVIGINPAGDSLLGLIQLNHMLDEIIQQYEIPTQSCILTHITTCMQMMEKGSGRPAVPKHCRHGSRQCRIWHQLEDAGRRIRGGKIPAAWNNWRQLYVFRNRTRFCLVFQYQLRSRRTDL